MIFFIFSIACMTRLAFARSGSPMIAAEGVGDDLPGQAEPVLQPAALAFRPPSARKAFQ